MKLIFSYCECIHHSGGNWDGTGSFLLLSRHKQGNFHMVICYQALYHYLAENHIKTTPTPPFVVAKFRFILIKNAHNFQLKTYFLPQLAVGHTYLIKMSFSVCIAQRIKCETKVQTNKSNKTFQFPILLFRFPVGVNAGAVLLLFRLLLLLLR